MRVLIVVLALLSSTNRLAAQTTEATARAHEALAQLARDGFQGSVLVANRDSILLHGDYGVPDDVTVVRYGIASATKGLTAIATLRLGESGKLSLDDELSKYFPDAPPDKRSIKLFDLLTHQSGLPQNYAADGVADRDSAAAAILAQPLAHEPGAEFTYSNDGYSLLAIIIELASGVSYRAFLKQAITDPLGLQEIAFWPDEMRPGEFVPPQLVPRTRPVGESVDWGFVGGHGARLSVAELYAIGVALKRGDLLSEESLALLFGPHRTLASGLGVGMGWFSETDAEGRDLLWTRGYDTSGENAVLYIVDNDLIIVAATNAGPAEDSGPGWSRRVRDAMLEIYATR